MKAKKVLKKISVKKIKIIKMRNRKGYAALCLDNLTEGKTTYQAYARMLKALRRGGMEISRKPTNLKHLITSIR